MTIGESKDVAFTKRGLSYPWGGGGSGQTVTCAKEELEASIEAVSDEVYKWRPRRPPAFGDGFGAGGPRQMAPGFDFRHGPFWAICLGASCLLNFDAIFRAGFISLLFLWPRNCNVVKFALDIGRSFFRAEAGCHQDSCSH